MRTRKDIDKDIGQLDTAKLRLKNELAQLEEQERALTEKIDESLLSGGDLENTGELAELRLRKDVLSDTLNLAGNKLQKAQEELDSLARAELGGQWYLLEKDIRVRLTKIQNMAGKNGLKSELDNLRDVVNEARNLAQYASQDAEIWTSKVWRLCDVESRSLTDFLASIDQV